MEGELEGGTGGRELAEGNWGKGTGAQGTGGRRLEEGNLGKGTGKGTGRTGRRVGKGTAEGELGTGGTGKWKDIIAPAAGKSLIFPKLPPAAGKP